MVVFIAIAGFILIAIIGFIVLVVKSVKESAEQESIDEANRRYAICDKYKEFPIRDEFSICKYDIFQNAGVIVLSYGSKNHELNFYNIRGSELMRTCSSTTGGKTKTSLGSVVGRSVVGGVIGGGVGAIIGGATALRESEGFNENEYYSLIIHMDSLENPIIEIDGEILCGWDDSRYGARESLIFLSKLNDRINQLVAAHRKE